jgi:hypothetical protein
LAERFCFCKPREFSAALFEQQGHLDMPSAPPTMKMDPDRRPLFMACGALRSRRRLDGPLSWTRSGRPARNAMTRATLAASQVAQRSQNNLVDNRVRPVR